MTKPRPPLTGYNHNFRHAGQVYHVQTEDTGGKTAVIETHVFADGGRVLASKKTLYREHLTRPDIETFLRTTMQAQHKELMRAVRRGEFELGDPREASDASSSMATGGAAFGANSIGELSLDEVMVAFLSRDSDQAPDG